MRGNKDPKVERIRMLRKLQMDMLIAVTTQQKKKILQKMSMFALQNQDLVKGNTPTFIYDGVWYTYSLPISEYRGIKANRTLHISLRDDIADLLSLEYETLLLQGDLQRYFGEAVTTANCISRLKEIIPYPLHEPIDLVDKVLYDQTPYTPDRVIEQFKLDNEEIRNQLSKLLMLELLLNN